MIRAHRPKIIVLIMPKISGAEVDVVCRKPGKSRWSRSEAKGFRGGVWLLWDMEKIDVKLLYVHKYLMHVEVQSDGGLIWELIEIYASPITHVRRHIWGLLYLKILTRPWVIIGNFNCVLKGEEQSSGAGVTSSFDEWVE